MSGECTVGCGKPADGMCSTCWGQLSAQLGAVEWLAVELDTALARQVRFGGRVGVVVRSHERPIPPNLAAGDTAHQLRNALTTWVRVLHEEHAVRWQQCDRCAAKWVSGDQLHDIYGCSGSWAEVIDPLILEDTPRELAQWLMRHPTWIRNHPAADELHADLTRAIGSCWRRIDRPPETECSGPCGADLDDTGVPCPAFLYGLKGARSVECQTCGAEHDVDVRKKWMTQCVDDEPVTASVALDWVHILTARRVRRGTWDSWVSRRQLSPWGQDRLGQPVFRFGDVHKRVLEWMAYTKTRAA